MSGSLMPPRARVEDPETSHEAADSVRNQTATHALILGLFRRYGAMTDHELSQRWAEQDGYPLISPSGLRSRRNELTDQLNQLTWTGQYRLGPTNRRMRVWAIAAPPLVIPR